jgi:hypothetical protein
MFRPVDDLGTWCGVFKKDELRNDFDMCRGAKVSTREAA